MVRSVVLALFLFSACRHGAPTERQESSAARPIDAAVTADAPEVRASDAGIRATGSQGDQGGRRTVDAKIIGITPVSGGLHVVIGLMETSELLGIDPRWTGIFLDDHGQVVPGTNFTIGRVKARTIDFEMARQELPSERVRLSEP